MTRLIIAAILGITVCGCVPSQEQLAMQAQNDDATCQSYGAKPGTDAYVQCRTSQQQQRTQIQAARIDAAPDTCIRNGNNVTCF